MAKCKAKVKRGPRKGEVCGRDCWQDSDKCWGHQAKEVKASKGFGGPQPNSGRPKLITPMDAARQLVAEKIDALIRPHFKALGYDIEVTYDREGPSLKLVELERGATIFGESKDGDVIASEYEDLAAQIAAAEKLMDRLWGRPKQAVEMSGGMRVEGVDTAPITNADREREVKQILEAQRAAVAQN